MTDDDDDDATTGEATVDDVDMKLGDADADADASRTTSSMCLRRSFCNPCSVYCCIMAVVAAAVVLALGSPVDEIDIKHHHHVVTKQHT